MNSDERVMLTHVKSIFQKRLEQMWEEVKLKKQRWNKNEHLMWKSQLKNLEEQLYHIEKQLFGYSMSQLTFYIPKRFNCSKH